MPRAIAAAPDGCRCKDEECVGMGANVTRLLLVDDDEDDDAEDDDDEEDDDDDEEEEEEEDKMEVDDDDVDGEKMLEGSGNEGSSTSLFVASARRSSTPFHPSK